MKTCPRWDSEDTVAEWEAQASTVKLSQLIGHYLERIEGAKTPARRPWPCAWKCLEDKNLALAAYGEVRFDARPPE